MPRALLTPEEQSTLANRLSERDDSAELEFVRLFSRRITFLAIARTHDVEASRDIAQEVLLAVVTALRNGGLRESDEDFEKRTTAQSGLPSSRSLPSLPGTARASSSLAAVIPASAARCAARMPSSSTGVFARRRRPTAASSTVRTTPSASSRSASASGKSPGTIASATPGPS